MDITTGKAEDRGPPNPEEEGKGPNAAASGRLEGLLCGPGI